MKTARFKEVVARSGRPEIHLSWSALASDKVLQVAAKRHRVMTVYQQLRGAKKDYGVAGLVEAPHVQYLVFPKSLRYLNDRRVVGIQYDLVDERVSSSERLPSLRPRAKSGSRKSSPKIVRFEAPAPAAKSPPPRETPQKATASRAVREKYDRDPTKRQILRAIEDLDAGDIAKARKRLGDLLRVE
jgi:hypothetical protein